MKFPYELTLVCRVDALETLPSILDKIRDRVTQIPAAKLDENGGEESGARKYVAGYYDFNLRDRSQVPDDSTSTRLPIRANLEKEGWGSNV